MEIVCDKKITRKRMIGFMFKGHFYYKLDVLKLSISIIRRYYTLLTFFTKKSSSILVIQSLLIKCIVIMIQG